MKRFRVTFEGCIILEAEDEDEIRTKLDGELNEIKTDCPFLSGLLYDLEEEELGEID